MTTSFKQLVDEHGPAVSRIAASYAPPGAGREDLNQEIWLAVWRALPRFRGESLLRTYVFRIAHNRGSTWAIRHKPLELLEDPSRLTDEGEGPEKAASERQEVQQLMRVIRSLPIGHRQVLTLVLEGLSHQEVGETLGLTENAVGVRLHRARKAVRQVMGERDV
ncbi:MAG: sigma-70 family RNA polymerase sigma factor [Proteobacteria bacterium]|nr:sigma-70 family RNA polymerase sigma factor [Pseudomonadota bacterium]